jgi:hypothetical protein
MDTRKKIERIKKEIISRYDNNDREILNDTDYEKVKFLTKYNFLTKEQINKLNIKLGQYENNKIDKSIQKNNDAYTAENLKYLQDLQDEETKQKSKTTFKELLTDAMNEDLGISSNEEKEEATPAGEEQEEKEKDNEFIQEPDVPENIQDLIDKQLPLYADGKGNEYYRMLYIDGHASEMDSMTEEHKSEEVQGGSKTKSGKTQKKKKKKRGQSRAKQQTIKNKVGY